MENPKTKLSDYLKYREECDALEDSVLRGELPNERLIAESDALLEKFRGKVFPEDIHYFDDFQSYRSFVLIETGGDINAMMLILHEKQHASEAEKRGIKFRYGCALLLNDVSGTCDDDRTIDSFIALIDVDTKAAKNILDTCKNPSERDKELKDML